MVFGHAHTHAELGAGWGTRDGRQQTVSECFLGDDSLTEVRML